MQPLIGQVSLGFDEEAQLESRCRVQRRLGQVTFVSADDGFISIQQKLNLLWIHVGNQFQILNPVPTTFCSASFGSWIRFDGGEQKKEFLWNLNRWEAGREGWWGSQSPLAFTDWCPSCLWANSRDEINYTSESWQICLVLEMKTKDSLSWNSALKSELLYCQTVDVALGKKKHFYRKGDSGNTRGLEWCWILEMSSEEVPIRGLSFVVYKKGMANHMLNSHRKQPP